jgi:hypothetical protein
MMLKSLGPKIAIIGGGIGGLIAALALAHGVLAPRRTSRRPYARRLGPASACGPTPFGPSSRSDWPTKWPSLAGVVQQTLQPAHLSVWIRPRE